MRKLTLILSAAAGAFLAAPLAAHPEDEFGSYNRGPTTSELAQAAIERLIAQKKLAPSWSGARLASFDFRSNRGVEQYVLTYENPAVKQTAKRKLFVVMSTSGAFVSAGHKLN